MRQIFYGFFVLLVIGMLAGCVQKKAPVDENVRPMSYEESDLESFLDSVGHLPIEPMVNKASKYADSVFHGLKNLSIRWSEADLQQLTEGAKKGRIPEVLAKKYQLQYRPEMVNEGNIPARLLFFETPKEEFAISIGPEHDWGAEVYFFQNRLCIAYQKIGHRYGLEIDHYVDAEGKTVIYYKENFESGTGIWWFDFYFYRYEYQKLVPILRELQNGNLSVMSAYQARWLESSVINTNPLTLKMIYYLTGENGEDIINDSTEVQYNWDVNSKTLQGDYQHSKLSKEQVLSYNLGSPNDLFFIRAHYDLFKLLLKDGKKRKLILYYLNDVKAELNDE